MKYEATPFRHWIIDQWTQPFSYDFIPAPSWTGWEATYDNDLERCKRTTRKIGQLPDDVCEVFTRLTDPDFALHWSQVTKIGNLDGDPTMYGAGLHTMAASGWLQTHLDWELHPERRHMERRLSLIAFLHPTWEPQWGGQLLLCDPMGKTVQAIEPVPGRLVAFESHGTAYHGVRQLGFDAPPRVTATAYLLGPARPKAQHLRARFLPNRQSPGCPAEVAL